MITFRALSRLHPGRLDLDPRLYQYGGLWIYPVGGLLRLAAAAHRLTLRTDLAFYLDHPDAFARFYVVARLYSAAWGLVGVVVVYGLARELTGRTLVAATAAGVYAAMPVVVNAAHEAKPHLAGTVLTLATVWAAARYRRTGRGWAWAAALAGAAAGMVLTGVAAWAVLPVMAWRRPRTAALAVLVAAGVFVVDQPVPAVRRPVPPRPPGVQRRQLRVVLRPVVRPGDDRQRRPPGVARPVARPRDRRPARRGSCC